ncbi:MAG TPA: outer membrane protein assembly factor BamE [Eoetvoesiella sp.]|uniref:outer membrane protein assembly factor BamE n=1 Tax=Eoetvoesiella sp. TaxID=1966355 RepID=UPI002CAC7C24|nr:outer membrane protein assembly factor BamE [Eoetvoesiella sp.]HWK60587.1 outer membrane protein assembly factor BamE [Eoetvoesiella sp.]
MLKSLQTIVLRSGGILLAVALAACGNLSQVSDQGTTSEPVWPDPASASFEAGSYPKVDALRLIEPGMSKDQLYNLLGRPHFGEGLAGVREWDYLFHFRTSRGEKTCQYKILFDKDKHARSFFWKPEACVSQLN